MRLVEEAVEIPGGPLQLKPNGHGGYLLRQSDLKSWDYCQLRKYYESVAREDPEAPQPEVLSATAFGTVLHYALMLVEQLHHEGRNDALAVAQATFEHYWDPRNITKLTPPVQVWIKRQTYGGLRERGRRILRDYYALLCKELNERLLALEYRFAVPLRVNGRTHTLTGIIDRFAIRFSYRKPYQDIGDYKSGKQPVALRHNIQGSAYAYATTRSEFWHGWAQSGAEEMASFDPDTVDMLERVFHGHGYQLHDRHSVPDGHSPAPVRFRWINVNEMKSVDGGWRNDRDYARLKIAADAYVRANEAGIYSPSISGDTCPYCPFRRTCGGVGLPSEDDGAITRN